MTSATSVTAIGAAKRRKFIAHKMFTSRTTVPASAKDPYLVNKIAFFQCSIFAMICKYNFQ